MSRTGSRKIKKLFLKQNGACYWCGCRMVLFNESLMFGKKAHKRLPGNLATFDHAYNKLSAVRVKGQAQPGVAACMPCNNARGAFDVILHERGYNVGDIWDFSRAGLASAAEQAHCKRKVGGSSPSTGTIPVRFKGARRPPSFALPVKVIRWDV